VSGKKRYCVTASISYAIHVEADDKEDAQRIAGEKPFEAWHRLNAGPVVAAEDIGHTWRESE
jgi:hypothetical protein